MSRNVLIMICIPAILSGTFSILERIFFFGGEQIPYWLHPINAFLGVAIIFPIFLWLEVRQNRDQ